MTTSRSLSVKQLSRLSDHFSRLIETSEWRVPLEGESEPRYTGSVLLPAVMRMIEALDKPGLVVRADGGAPPRPLSLFNVEFYPDLELAYFDNRSLAVEVKYVRSSDPTGSISKALGQALIYRARGFPRVHVVLIDIRFRASKQTDELSTMEGVVVHHVIPARK